MNSENPPNTQSGDGPSEGPAPQAPAPAEGRSQERPPRERGSRGGSRFRRSSQKKGRYPFRSKYRYCVIVPAYNVGKDIASVVKRLRQQGLTTVVVDDGSSDNTAQEASSQGAIVISHVTNQGKGSALRTGFRYALKGDYDGVITYDGDGQFDVREIQRLIYDGERQHAGIVLGNRLKEKPPGMPRSRYMANRLAASIVSKLTRQSIPDAQCGLRLVRKEVLASVSLKAKGFELESELLLAASKKKWKIISVPVRPNYGGRPSHVRPVRDALRFMRLLLRNGF